MTFSLGIVGAGQFSGQFAKLFLAHPGVREVHVTDLLPERAERLAATEGLSGTFPSYEAMLESKAVDAVAIFTQRWTHGPLVLQGLNSRQARVLGRADGGLHGGDRGDHRRRAGHRADVHDGRDQPVQPGDRARAQPDRRGRLRPAVLRGGRLRPRHGSRVLRRVPVQRRRELEGDRQLSPASLPDALGGRGARGLADARGERVRDRGARRARGRCLRQGGQPVRQRLLQRHRAVRGGGRRLVPYERIPAGRLSLTHPGVAFPVLRYRRQHGAARHGELLAGQEGGAGHHRTAGAEGDTGARRSVAPAHRAGCCGPRSRPGRRPSTTGRGCPVPSTVSTTVTRAATTSWRTTS